MIHPRAKLTLQHKKPIFRVQELFSSDTDAAAVGAAAGAAATAGVPGRGQEPSAVRPNLPMIYGDVDLRRCFPPSDQIRMRVQFIVERARMLVYS